MIPPHLLHLANIWMVDFASFGYDIYIYCIYIRLSFLFFNILFSSFDPPLAMILLWM